MPYALSLITTSSLTGQVKGLREYSGRRPAAGMPALSILQDHAGLSVWLLVLLDALVSLGLEKGQTCPRARSENRKWLLTCWMMAIPLSYIAMEAGWVVREVGRQPWVIQGVLRTEEGVSRLPAENSGWVFARVLWRFTPCCSFFFFFLPGD